MRFYYTYVLQVVPQAVSIVRFHCISTGTIGGLNSEVLLYVRTSSGPIGGLSCEVPLYFNWSHRWSQL